MASYLEQLTARDLALLARIAAIEPDRLRTELRHRPWLINDLLADPKVYQAVMEDKSLEAGIVSPFFLFAILLQRAASEIRNSTYINDWTGPKERLPVFDVAPLQEFLDDPARTFFLVAVLASFAVPQRLPLPAHPFDLFEIAGWVESAQPEQRAVLLRRLGDLSLLLAGVFPDKTGPAPLGARDAQRLGNTVGMRGDELLELCDGARIGPGLSAMEILGARWYQAASVEQGMPLILNDVAVRFRSARRVLNHVTDRYLYRLDPRWNVAA